MAEKPRFVMCICTGECPGFAELDLWPLVNRVRNELDVEYAIASSTARAVPTPVRRMRSVSPRNRRSWNSSRSSG